MAGANLVQPVFMGGIIANGNKLAEVGEAVAELQSRQSSDQVRLTVEQYYWQLASLKARRYTVDKVISMLDTLELCSKRRRYTSSRTTGLWMPTEIIR